MEDLIIFFSTLLLCLIGRFVIYLINKKRSKSKKRIRKELMPIEIKYLSHRFKIKKEKLNKKSFMLLASCVDGFIVGVTVVCVIRVSDIMFIQMLLGLLIVLSLIFIIYECIGRIIVKKGE